jgi:hypothetical protein
MAKRAWLRIWAFITTLMFGSREAAYEAIEHQGATATAWNPGGLKHIVEKPAENRTAADVALTQQGPPPAQSAMPPHDGWPWDDIVDDEDDWAALTA